MSTLLPLLPFTIENSHIINAERYLSGAPRVFLSILLHDAKSGPQVLRYRSLYMIICSRLEMKYGTSGVGLLQTSRCFTLFCGTVRLSRCLSTSKVRPYPRIIVLNSASSTYRIALSGLATHLSHSVRIQPLPTVKPSLDCPKL
jgi:hypothetical protein